jgi:hypothetical protein
MKKLPSLSKTANITVAPKCCKFFSLTNNYVPNPTEKTAFYSLAFAPKPKFTSPNPILGALTLLQWFLRHYLFFF